jgi:WD40-like Beta Propeller Repeat
MLSGIIRGVRASIPAKVAFRAGYLVATFCAAYLLVTAASPTRVPILLSNENAYNPVPSPDGKKIAAVRTGWGRWGGSGGTGRSNLRSELIILNRAGRTLSSKPLADSFVADWNQDGIVSFRDWSYALLSENGSIRKDGRVCSSELIHDPFSGCTERVAYLPFLGSFVWVHQKFGDSALVTPRGELSSHHCDRFLSEWLVPSPNERYVAIGPVRLGLKLNVYDLQEKAWIDLGRAIIHPDQSWYWFQPSWSPWFADSSQLAFFTADGLVISSPDGERRRTVLRTKEPAGLAVPSPDGRRIAYATYPSGSRTSGIWVIGVEESAQPQRIVEQAPGSIYDLRWLDNEHLVFDRIENGSPPRARIWLARVRR